MSPLPSINYQTTLEGLVLLAYLTFVYYAIRTKIPLIPTQKAAREALLSVVRTEIRPKQKVRIYDLGSGAGGLCLAVAKEFPNAEVIGLEMAWPIWLFACLRQKASRRKNVSFKLINFWKHDIGEADVVFFYLGDVVMKKMGDKLRRETRRGCLIVSNTFPLPPDWPILRRIRIPAKVSKDLYVYRQTASPSPR
jgi:hypothetical protein